MKLNTVALLVMLLHPTLFAKTDSKKEAGTFLYGRVKEPYKYNSDTLLQIIKKEHVQEENYYYVKADSLKQLFKEIHSLDKLLLFNEKNCLYNISDGKGCINPLLILKYHSISDIAVDTTQKLDDFINKCNSFTPTKFTKTWPTAIIFWNLTQGILSENNPFEWEKQLQEKFNFQVNIIKVNTDVNQNWPIKYQNEMKLFFDKFLYQLSSSVMVEYEK